MNRVIKFRAWETPINENSNDFKGAMHYGVELYDWFGKRLVSGSYRVMQFAGVQDRNKKDLYEGDIVKSNVNGKLYEVRRFNNHFYCGFVPRAIDGSNDNLSFEHEFEIVGNVFENTDLLSNNSK